MNSDLTITIDQTMNAGDVTYSLLVAQYPQNVTLQGDGPNGSVAWQVANDATFLNVFKPYGCRPYRIAEVQVENGEWWEHASLSIRLEKITQRECVARGMV